MVIIDRRLFKVVHIQMAFTYLKMILEEGSLYSQLSLFR